MICVLIVSQETKKEWPLVVAMGSARDPREVRERSAKVREGAKVRVREGLRMVRDGPRRSAKVRDLK